MEEDNVTQDPVSVSIGNQAPVVSRNYPHKNGSLTKSDWIRIAAWAVPIIFMAAMMYFSVNQLAGKSLAHDEHLKSLDEATGDLSSNHKVMEEKVGEINKKQDSLINVVDKMDDKLDEQAIDLAAIREKLKVTADR